MKKKKDNDKYKEESNLEGIVSKEIKSKKSCSGSFSSVLKKAFFRSVLISTLIATSISAFFNEGDKKYNSIFFKDGKPYIMHAFDYAERLKDKEIDDYFVTNAEIMFEKLYPHFNLHGENENLTKSNIDFLISCIEEMPQKNMKSFELNLVFAMQTYKNKSWVDYEIDRAGHYCHFDKEIVYFSPLSKNLIWHEFTHALHYYHSEKETIEEQWKNLEIFIDGKKTKITELYDELIDETKVEWVKDGQSTPRYGFAEPYGSYNLEEDLATTVPFIINQKLVDCKESYLIMLKKAKILFKYDFIREKHFDNWKDLNECKFQSN